MAVASNCALKVDAGRFETGGANQRYSKRGGRRDKQRDKHCSSVFVAGDDPSAMTSNVNDESTLLRVFVEQHSQAAFASLVQRRIGLVYSVAMRQVAGDT